MMIEFIQENLTTILGGTGIGAVLGGIVGLIVSRDGNAMKVNEETLSEMRSMVSTLGLIKSDMTKTRSGFDGIIGLLNPGADTPLSLSANATSSATASTTSLDTTASTHAPSAKTENSNGVEQTARDGLDMAEKLLAAVLAIPALPKIPDFASNFDMAKDNDVLSAIFDQLNGLDTHSVNTMIGEFKNLVENTIKPGLERAQSENIDLILEPETIETLVKGAGSFVKSIGGMSGIVDVAIDRLNDVVAELS